MADRKQIETDAKRAIALFTPNMPSPFINQCASAFASLVVSSKPAGGMTTKKAKKTPPPKYVLRKCDSDEFDLSHPQFSKIGRSKQPGRIYEVKDLTFAMPAASAK